MDWTVKATIHLTKSDLPVAESILLAWYLHTHICAECTRIAVLYGSLSQFTHKEE